MLDPKAFVASVGARTSIGSDALQTAMLFRAGACGMRAAPLSDVDGEAVTMCFDPTLDPRLTGWERAVKLATPPLEDALKPLVGRIDGSGVKLMMCIDERYGRAGRGQMETDAATALVAGVMERAHQLLPGITVSVTARGSASAGICLPEALSALASRKTEAVVLGAVHSDYEPAWIGELSAHGRLFKPDNLDAYIPGEAAVFLVLMREDAIRRAGLVPMAGIIAAASGHEAATPENDLSSYDAKGLTQTIRDATKEMSDAGMTAGWALTDLTFEMWKVAEWQAMLIRTRNLWAEPYVVDSPSQRIGQLGAAAMPLGMAMCAIGWHHGSAPAPIAVVYAGSDGGERGAALLAMPTS
jgi:3-oxoacyl-[acyl-carrier-protein] synthase-1